MSIYTNLKKVRLYLGLSQSQFAKKLDVNVSNISRWENKNNGMTLDMAYTIAEKLCIPIEVLVSDDFGINNQDFISNEFLLKFKKLSDKDKKIVSNLIDSMKE